MGKLWEQWADRKDVLQEQSDAIEEYIMNELDPNVSIVESEIEEIEEEYEEVKKEFKRLDALMQKKEKALAIAKVRLKTEQSKADAIYKELQQWEKREPDQSS